MLDLPGRAPELEKKHFARSDLRTIFGNKLAFSPDGRYFVVTGGSEQIVYDMSARQALKIPAPLNEFVQHGFVFLDAGRIMVHEVTPDFRGLGGVFSFAGGKLLDTIPLGRPWFFTPTRGDYALLFPFGKYAIGILDLKPGGFSLLSSRERLISITTNMYARLRTAISASSIFSLCTRSNTPHSQRTIPTVSPACSRLPN